MICFLLGVRTQTLVSIAFTDPFQKSMEENDNPRCLLQLTVVNIYYYSRLTVPKNNEDKLSTVCRLSAPPSQDFPVALHRSIENVFRHVPLDLKVGGREGVLLNRGRGVSAVGETGAHQMNIITDEVD